MQAMSIMRAKRDAARVRPDALDMGSIHAASTRAGHGLAAAKSSRSPISPSPGGHRYRFPGFDFSRTQRRVTAKREVRAMVNYLVFLTFFTTVAMWGRNDHRLNAFNTGVTSYLADNVFTLEGAPSTMADVVSLRDVYSFLEDSLYPQLYTRPTTGAGGVQQGTLLDHGYFVGGIRIGTLRWQRGPCLEVPPALAEYAMTCSQVGSLNTSDFGVNNAFPYRPASSSEPVWESEFGFYAPPSHYVVLPRQERNGTALAAIQQLREAQFLDASSGALFIDFALYNPELHVMLSTRLGFLIFTSGEVKPVAESWLNRAYAYHRHSDYVRMALEMIVMAFVAGYTVYDLRIMLRSPLTYFRGHRLLHIVNMTLFYVVFGLRLAVELTAPRYVADNDDFVHVRGALMMAVLASDINALNAFLSWMKSFEYLGFIPTFAQLTQTLSRAAAGVTGFAVIFGLIMFASALSFLLTFGAGLNGFRNLSTSFFSLLRALLGDFEFEELRAQNRFLGPLFFAAFMLLAVFVLLNVFIAIVSDAYAQTKLKLELESDIGLDTVGAQVLEYLLNDVLFRIPLLGRLLEEVHRRTSALAAAARAQLHARIAAIEEGHLDSLLDEAAFRHMMQTTDADISHLSSRFEYDAAIGRLTEAGIAAAFAELDADGTGHVPRSLVNQLIADGTVGATPASPTPTLHTPPTMLGATLPARSRRVSNARQLSRMMSSPLRVTAPSAGELAADRLAVQMEDMQRQQTAMLRLLERLNRSSHAAAEADAAVAAATARAAAAAAAFPAADAVVTPGELRTSATSVVTDAGGGGRGEELERLIAEEMSDA